MSHPQPMPGPRRPTIPPVTMDATEGGPGPDRPQAGWVLRLLEHLDLTPERLDQVLAAQMPADAEGADAADLHSYLRARWLSQQLAALARAVVEEVAAEDPIDPMLVEVLREQVKRDRFRFADVDHLIGWLRKTGAWLRRADRRVRRPAARPKSSVTRAAARARAWLEQAGGRALADIPHEERYLILDDLLRRPPAGATSREVSLAFLALEEVGGDHLPQAPAVGPRDPEDLAARATGVPLQIPDFDRYAARWLAERKGAAKEAALHALLYQAFALRTQTAFAPDEFKAFCADRVALAAARGEARAFLQRILGTTTPDPERADSWSIAQAAIADALRADREAPAGTQFAHWLALLREPQAADRLVNQVQIQLSRWRKRMEDLGLAP